jgi:hypothetical protein
MAAYLASWLEALKNDSRTVLGQARKAADLVLGLNRIAG